MAFNKEIYDLARLAARGKGYNTETENFSAVDVSESLKSELKKYVGNFYHFQKINMTFSNLLQ